MEEEISISILKKTDRETVNMQQEIPPSNYRSAKKLLAAPLAFSFFLLAPEKFRKIKSKCIRFCGHRTFKVAA
jgi:hypothetical protein